MNKADFLILTDKIIDGSATEQEIAAYNYYLNFFLDQEGSDEQDEQPAQPVNRQSVPLPDQQLADGLKARIDYTIDHPRKTRTFTFYRAIAAAAVLVIISFTFFKISHREDKKVQTASARVVIKPGGNKATLTLANGRKIILDSVGNGTLASEDNVTIRKSADGQLVYQFNKVKGNRTGPAAMNTITTPHGGQYQISLSDGTKVWLNAKSSLRFPADFSGDLRQVELKGEAYFEVSKNKFKPFVVTADQAKIQVLGTHFNIKAYDDETETKTTLLEGSVAMSSGGKESLLKPGQYCLLDHQTGKMNVAIAKSMGEGDVAWKNGDFMFVNEDIHSVMRQISRWYDVDIQYQGNFKDLRFGGMISRFKDISEVLKLLQLTDAVHFKIDGRRVIVMT